MEEATLVCEDCGEEFIFSAEEQEFYMSKGFQTPKRCKPCRAKRKDQRRGFGERRTYPAVCADCGQETQVPFMPREDRPVYCRDCYQKRK
jgi:CxxC-x17-CxxC domain-containing protein